MAMRIPGERVGRSAVRSLAQVPARVGVRRDTLAPGAAPPSRTGAARRAAYRMAMDRLLAEPDKDPQVLPVVADDDTPIHVVARGPVDGVPIVFTHGWACSSRVWNAQVNELSSRFRVICYDQRGHGRTPSGAAPATLDTLADDLSAVLRSTISPGRPAILVGHSMGGMTISAWAGRHPDEVTEYARAVMLASTASNRLLHDFGVLPFPERLPGAFTLGRAAMAAPVSSTLLPSWGFQYVSLGADATPAQVAFSREIVNACRARVRGRWGTAMSELDVREGLENLVVPTTVLVGTGDRLTPPVHARRMAETLREAGNLERMVELDGVGHMTQVEAPYEVNAQIRHLEYCSE